MPDGNLTRYRLADLPERKPTGEEVTGAWRYLKAAHASVGGVFDALQLVRERTATSRGDRRGQLTSDQQDLLRAAIVFTSSGLDASCQRLLRDSLPVLVRGSSGAAGEYLNRLNNELSTGRISKPLRSAICSTTPRVDLIEFHISSLVGSSLQSTTDLKRVRDALGVAPTALPDSSIEMLKSFFAARNNIAHQLDYKEKDGSGGRVTQVMADVRDQCDQVLSLLVTLITLVAGELRTAKRTLVSQVPV